MANIKYVGNDTQKSEKGKIHVKEGNYTGCGAQINDNPKDWELTEYCEEIEPAVRSLEPVIAEN